MKNTSNLPRAAFHRGILRAAAVPESPSITRLVELIEEDYQFRLGYLVISALTQSARVSIELTAPEDEGARAALLAENLRAVWSRMLPSALRAFAYGRAAFEKTYSYDVASRTYLIADLDYLPPEYTSLVVARDGGFDGIDLSVGAESVHLGSERVWWFALDATATHPHGRSRYLGAPHQVWQARRQLDEQEQIWFSKFAIGHGVARAPERPGTVLAADQLPEPMEAMRRELESIESGGILILSSQRYPDGTYLYDYRESEGQWDSRPLEQRRQMLDAAALRSLGIPERAVTQDQHPGSRAMAQVHLEVLYRTCEEILEQLIASFEHYVVRKIVEVNWPTGARPTYRVSHAPLGDSTAPASTQEELARSLVLADRLPELARRGNVDVDQILARANIPRGSGQPMAAGEIPWSRRSTNGHAEKLSART